MHSDSWLAREEAGIGAMLSLLLFLPLATKVNQTNAMYSCPRNFVLHLLNWQAGLAS